MRIICCKFGDKFSNWHVDNLRHMIDTYSGIEYDKFEVIEDDLYGNWYNKFQMYDKFRDDSNIYFDLDMVIFGKLRRLQRNHFTLLNDTWWREPAHTPLNSSIVSWTGDVSYIWDKFKSNDEYYLKRYNKGSDEFYYHEIKYQEFPDICPSIKNHMLKKPENFNICTFGQMHHLMEIGWTGWWTNFFLSR
jgi:hypothetical protein